MTPFALRPGAHGGTPQAWHVQMVARNVREAARAARRRAQAAVADRSAASAAITVLLSQ